MITGVVSSRREIQIRLPVCDAAGQLKEVETILDSGFNGTLTLPPELIRLLGLPWRSRGSAYLANGSLEQFDIYLATVTWNGNPRTILVQELDTSPLLGMALLAGHELRARIVAGGKVEIEAIQ